MSTDERAPRFLGATFLGVILTSMATGVLFTSVAGSGTASDMMAKVAANPAPAHAAVLAGIATSIGVVVLAALLYVVLRTEQRTLALIALGLWLVEAAFMAVSQIGASGFITLSREFVAAGSPADSGYQALGDFLYTGIDKFAVTIHMAFYLAGGLIWYSLFWRSRLIPRAISGFGVAAAGVGLAGAALALLGNNVQMFPYIALFPFELSIGIWLLIKGTTAGTAPLEIRG